MKHLKNKIIGWVVGMIMLGIVLAILYFKYR